MRRAAVADALGLLDRGLGVAEAPGAAGRVLLARARAHEAGTAFDRRLPTSTRRCGWPGAAATAGSRWRPCGPAAGTCRSRCSGRWSTARRHLEAGLALASGLGDRRAEADFTARLAVLDAGRLQLSDALRRAERGLRAGARGRLGRGHGAGARRREDGTRVPRRAERLREVVAELEPVLRGAGNTWLLQWAVFESAFVAGRHGDWEAARRRRGPGRRGQPTQRVRRLRRLLRGPPRLVRPARRRPGERAARRSAGRRADVTDRPPVVVRHRRRAAGRAPSWRPASRRRPPTWPGAGWPRDRTRHPRGLAAALPGPARGGDRRRAGPAPTPPCCWTACAARPAPPGWSAPTATSSSRRPAATAATPTPRPRSLAPLRAATGLHWRAGPGARRRPARSDQLARPAEPRTSAPSVGTGR